MSRAARELCTALAFALIRASGARAAECPDPGACIGDYVALPARLPGAALVDPPLSDAAVQELVADLGAIPVRHERLAPGELAGAIEQALALTPLRRALAETPIEVSATGTREQRLVFRDPYVGAFEGILLLPEGSGPFPAVLALHGHGDRAEVYRDLHHGRDYPAHGIALLMLTLRGMNLDAHEYRAWHALLSRGLHLMGVRVYEAERALAYLRARPEIDAHRVGLIGHSGGSSVGNLLVRLEPGLTAYVSDHYVDFRSKHLWEPDHCEIVPGLVPLSALINDLSTARVPVLRVPYGYGRRKWLGLEARESRRILDFFAGKLEVR